MPQYCSLPVRLQGHVWAHCAVIRWPMGNNTEQVTCCGQHLQAAATQAEESSTGHLNFICIFKLPVAASGAGGLCQQHAALVGKHWFGVAVNKIAGFFFSETKSLREIYLFIYFFNNNTASCS